MLVVISNPKAVADEVIIINALFDEGLEVLHLRKPDYGKDEIRSLMEKIKPQYYKQIALHQHHELADDFGINRLHYTEANRKATEGQPQGIAPTSTGCRGRVYPCPGLHVGIEGLENHDYILSTSIHNVEDYKKLSSSFAYTFFGPVFDSISKVGYTSSLSDDFVFPVEPGLPKVIAIGGIDPANIQRAKEMKFDGAAALGTIWRQPANSVSQFKALQKAWEQAGR